MAKSPPLSVFCSYAHKDDKLRREVQSGLAALSREGLIQMWHDQEITAGSKWAYEIDQRLEASDIILLLVSSNFFKSDYCMGVEYARARARHERSEARLIPIILELCDWKGLLGELQALPFSGEPLRSYTVVNKRRLLEISFGMRKVVAELCANGDGAASRRPSSTLDASQTVLAHLCNRVQQDRQLRDAWERHYSSFQLRRRPFVCVIHGRVQEDHVGYVQRMAAYSLPQAMGLGRDSQIRTPLKVRWAEDSADREAFFSSMMGNLAKELDCPAQFSEVPVRLNRLIGEAGVVYYELFSNSKTYGNRLALESFFEFWARWPDLPVRQKLIVVFSVQYRPGAPPGFPRQEADIVRNAAQQGSLSAVVLDELPSVSSQNVKDWIRHPEVERFCEVETNVTAWEAEIDDTFRDRAQIPMEQLVGTLNRMLNDYQRRAV